MHGCMQGALRDDDDNDVYTGNVLMVLVPVRNNTDSARVSAQVVAHLCELDSES
eukprot:COSAG02_NODE_26971_length_620_cov_0.689060_2_plen_54_part_00